MPLSINTISTLMGFCGELCQEVVDSLFYAHSRVNANTTKTREAASLLYAFIGLLSEKGILAVEELDERKRVVGQRNSRKRAWVP